VDPQHGQRWILVAALLMSFTSGAIVFAAAHI